MKPKLNLVLHGLFVGIVPYDQHVEALGRPLIRCTSVRMGALGTTPTHYDRWRISP